MTWLLWNRRNNLRLGLTAKPLSQIISAAGGMLQDFLVAQEGKSEAVQMTSPVQWYPRALNQYKANFDGAVFRSCSAAGLGVVVRDWRGAVIGALLTRVPLPQSVADVEALACRRAVMFAVEIGLREVVFEGDAAVVIQAINCGSAEFSSYGHIIDDIIHHSSALISSEFCYVNRSCNKVADVLAKKARAGLELQVWRDDMPGEKAPLVFADIR